MTNEPKYCTYQQSTNSVLNFKKKILTGNEKEKMQGH